MRLKRLLIIAKVIPKLGFDSFVYMVYYTLSLKLGWRKRKFKYSEYLDVKTPVLSSVRLEVTKKLNNNQYVKIIDKANGILDNQFIYYSNHSFRIENNIYWLYDPYSQKELKMKSKHWTEINEFDLTTGDIKNLWELSRFDWVITLVKAYAVTDDTKYLHKINFLLSDWCRYNSYNQGVNWKCGQEVSVRIMKLYNASLVLNGLYEINESLFDFIYKHLERVHGNINYAIAQNNNHGTTESAALYIGSLWLLQQTKSTLLTNQVRKKLVQYKNRGRGILENRILKLVLTDGTFTQKSVNYHRVVVDTMSFVLSGMQEFKEPTFSATVLTKLDKLGTWLLDFISNDKGEVPNLGPNDGAMFEQLHELDYRDFRPSVQLFFGLLHNQIIWDFEEISAPLIWRNIDFSKFERRNELNQNSIVKDKEFVQIIYKDIKTLIVSKQDNFRPSNDILHLDVFYKGVNVLLDTGSYSYNRKETNLFKSIKSHNTIQFGDSEPMPKISRFLNGEWIRVNTGSIVENEDRITWEGFYCDYKRNHHKRKVYIDKRNFELVVVDSFKSSSKGQEVKLNFHLINDFQNYLDIICIDYNGNKIEMLRSKGEHSLYYMDKSEHIIGAFLSTELEGTFTTTLKFK